MSRLFLEQASRRENMSTANTAETNDGGSLIAVCSDANAPIEYVPYVSEVQLYGIMEMMSKELSEPYSIFTYRYFIRNWPNLCFLAMSDGKMVGTIVCKAEHTGKGSYRGYIAMLAVDKAYRKHGIGGSKLAEMAIGTMRELGCDEAVLETEESNKGALRLYENLGFARDKRLSKYYLNGGDAFRLKLWFK